MHCSTLKLFSIVLSLFVYSLATFGDTPVSGAVRGTWIIENTPYVAVDNLTVGARDTLIIEPGVTVRFSGRYSFEIEGILIAEGAEGDSIFFISSNPAPNTWVGIRLSGGTASNCRLDYCAVKHAYRGIEFNIASPTVTNSSFVIHSNNGLRFEDSSAEIENCNISNIGGSGIVIECI